MIRMFIRLLCCLALVDLAGCAHMVQTRGLAPEAQMVERNYIDCFEQGLVSAKGKPAVCEASAAVFTGNSVIIGSDKPIFGKSPVFALPFNGNGLGKANLTYLSAPAIVQARKYEDFTLTPDGRYVIATTGFDRVKSDSHDWDAYNTLVAWPVNQPGAARVAAPFVHEGVTSSVGLRPKLSTALATKGFPSGMPYFKVEGIAALPGNRLIFGIRELGARYDDFDYAITLVQVSYEFENDRLILGDDFSLVYDYNPAVNSELAHSVALSSIEYDPYHHRLYLLTSFEEEETDEGLGAYLWTLPIPAFERGCAPDLVMEETGTPLVFAHKAEGLAVLDSHRVFVVHDDDRVLGRERVENPRTQFHRLPNQAAYTIVTLAP